MKILFVFNVLGLGGMETLLLRMAKYIYEQGGTVGALYFSVSDQDMLYQLKQYAKVIVTNKILDAPFIKLNDSLDDYDYIYCCGVLGLLRGLMIQQTYLINAKLCVGAYHPYDYAWPTSLRSQTQRLVRKILLDIPIKNILFMNEGCLKRHEKNLGVDLSKAAIIPLPLSIERFANIIRNPSKNKIISVGRITSFKTYNFHMVDVICELNKDHEIFEYHIYGDGDQFNQLKNYISARNAQKYVHLHGRLPYEKLIDIFSDVFVFVGHGTAALEAAACGIPALIAIENCSKPLTYGVFNESLGNNWGEYEADRKKYFLKDKILQLYQMSEMEYQSLSAMSKKVVQKYNIDNIMKQFETALLNAKEHKLYIPRTVRMWCNIEYFCWKIISNLGIRVNRYKHVI